MALNLIIILGLVVFEIVSSVDNAIVNAHMLKTMNEKSRRWFLVWGIFFAVFVVRGLLPLIIIWIAAPDITLLDAARATLNGSATARDALDRGKPLLLIGGGVFLLLLYFHWLFLEKKDPYFIPDKLVKHVHGAWFFGVAGLLLVGLLFLTRQIPSAMIAAAAGNAVFFILYGFRETAEQEERKLESIKSDMAKLLFLEVLDLSFSIDGVFGAFAFTTNVILILIGNGIGAIIIRELTVRGVDKVAEYRWLKNGAMTSIGLLGLFMILESLGVHIPEWIPTAITLAVVGITFWESHRLIRSSSR